MSSLLSQYMDKERQLEKLRAELENLEGSEALKADLAFKSELEELLKRHGKTAQEAVEVLDPNYSAEDTQPQTGGPQQRKKRKLKVFENPHTKERVETRGGNQKTLKAWKEEFGEDTVNGWLIEER